MITSLGIPKTHPTNIIFFLINVIKRILAIQHDNKSITLNGHPCSRSCRPVLIVTGAPIALSGIPWAEVNNCMAVSPGSR